MSFVTLFQIRTTKIGMFLVLMLIVYSGTVGAQSDRIKAEILKPINTLFIGMNKGDSAQVHSAFTREVSMATIYKDKSGNTVLRREDSLVGFLNAVGSPHAEVWSEPIWNVHIEVDGDFAQVWASYAFYLSKTFSHCGVDAFQLIKEEDGWKIFHLADTRQKENCSVPKEVSDQFK